MRKYFKIILTILLFVTMPSLTFSQYLKEKKADVLFDKYYYQEAITLYQEVIAQEEENFRAIKRLADCYRLVRNPMDAEEMYKRLIDANKHSSIDLYFYSSMLKSNGKYREADFWQKEYMKVSALDNRAKTKLSPEELFHKLLRDSFLYDIRLLNINTDKADMCPAYFNDQIVYSTPRDNSKKKRSIYGWNNQSFLDLIIADTDMSGSLVEAAEKFPDEVNSGLHEAGMCFNPVDSILYFTRNNLKGKKQIKGEDDVVHLKIFSVQYKNGLMSDLIEFKYNSDEYSTGHPSLSKDYDTLYFVSERPDGVGGTDIYYCKKMGESWRHPVNMGRTVNTEGDEMFPFMHPSGVLFFASDGHAGLGGLDIFKCYGDKEGKQQVRNLGFPVNSSKDDFGLIMSEDTKSGYFTSNRPGGFGDDDLYHIWFRDPPKMKIAGVAREELTKLPLGGAIVKVENPKTGEVQEVVADELGRFTCEVETDNDYKLIGSKEKYTDGTTDIFTDREKEEEMQNLEVLLKYSYMRLEGYVRDKNTGDAIEEAHLIIENPVTTEQINLVTNGVGFYSTDLKPLTYFKVRVEKDQYLAVNGQVVTNSTDRKTIRKDFAMEDLYLSKTIALDNIYYDLGSWNIRRDAAIELDKVVKIMRDNTTLSIELSSHTDSRGDAYSNQALSQKRAEAAVNYIASKGIDPSRMIAVGYGEDRPINRCREGVDCSEYEHQQNRRTEMKILAY